MATKNNITVVTRGGSEEGIGTQQLTVSGLQNYTGRDPFSATFKANGTNTYSSVTSSNMLTVTQSGSFIIKLTNPESNVPASGGNISITGEANLKKLKLTIGSNMTLVSATINDASLTSEQRAQLASSSGYIVTGDPGASAKYNISITVSVQANSSTSSRELELSMKDPEDGTKTDTATITQNGSSSPQPTNQVWFSNGSSSSPSTSPSIVTINLNADGSLANPNDDPRVNTSPSGVSWTISASN